MANYRVQKDNISFFVSPDLVPYYKDKGYRIFKPLEQEITDDDIELENAQTVTSAELAERVEIPNEN